MVEKMEIIIDIKMPESKKLVGIMIQGRIKT